MYIAELHGKFHPDEERKEDILTSNVFSFFKYARRDLFLNGLLTLLQLKIDNQDLQNAEFIFWPTYEDKTEPDLVIIVGNYYLLIEAKLHSGFGEGSVLEKYQIIREIQGGQQEAARNHKDFKFIAITAHYSIHQFITENPYVLDYQYQWINWHEITLLISSLLDKNEFLDLETKCFAEDLYLLLLKMKLRKFAGVDVISRCEGIKPQQEILFFDPTTSEHRGDFIGFINTLGEFSKVDFYTGSLFFRTQPHYFSSLSYTDNLAKLDQIFFKR